MQSKFEFNAKQVLLTYPQCTLAKEEVLKNLQALHEIDIYTVSEEQHVDGTPHVHCVLKLSKRKHSTNPRLFDLGTWHPNIATLKTRKDFDQAERYVRKDGCFITNVESFETPRIKLAKKIISAGRISQALISENPEIIYLNFSSITSWLSVVPRVFKAVPPLNKRRHVWVYGPSNIGKTYWLRAFLSTYEEPQEIPTNNDYKFVTYSTDVLYMDEYKGDLTVQALNRLCDGDTSLNTKGGSTKISYPTVVICSNFSISDCYKNSSNDILNTVYNRFHEYDLSQNKPKFYNCLIN